MSDQTLLTRRRWSIEGFRAFWRRPDPAVIARMHEIMTPDIVGHWPRPIGRIDGAAPYIGVIAAIAQVCPDLSMTAPDYACDGDLHFVRWEATGTLPEGRVSFGGIDRLRLNAEGLVAENYVCSDGPLFAYVAERLRLAAKAA